MGFKETPFWNSYSTLIEQSDRDYLIGQSDWDAPITVVLLEIIQSIMQERLLREECEGWRPETPFQKS